MTLTVSCVRLPSEEQGNSDSNQQRTYNAQYRIKQTDAGALATPRAMITAAQAVMAGNPLPIYGDEWEDDEDSYAQVYSWHRPHPADKPVILDVDIAYQPLGSGSSGGATHGRLVEPDPLLWPTTYHVEWTEEAVPIELAYNVEELPSIERSALTLGPVVNGCGIEFTEAAMSSVFYPVLLCEKPYESEADIAVLNATYHNTTNNATFFGWDAYCARYLSTEMGRIQKINGQEFYMGITRIWFKPENWDKKILNNGWSHFEFDPSDPTQIIKDAGIPLRFPNKVRNQTAAQWERDPDADPSAFAHEPLNLEHDGTLRPSNSIADYIGYRYLRSVDYTGIGIGG